MITTTLEQARELANLLGRPNEPHRTRYREAIESLSTQVEALTAERNKLKEASDFDHSEYKRLRNELTAERDAAEVRVGALLCERSDFAQTLMDERDSLRAELQIKSAECDLFQRGCDIRDAALDKLKQQKPVAWSVTVGNDYKNCIEITHCESDAVAQYEASTEGGFESIYTLHKLYAEEGAQPAEIEVLRADAARYAAKRKEIFLKRNRMQVSGPRSTEEEFNSEYDANCDKAIAGYVADHRGVLVFNSAMVAAKAAP